MGPQSLLKLPLKNIWVCNSHWGDYNIFLMTYKILIVDDNMDFLRVLENKLKDRYNVVIAFDGKTALEKMQTEKPDLVISDICMPGMTGYEFLNAIKQRRTEVGYVPIIVMSGQEDMAMSS